VPRPFAQVDVFTTDPYAGNPVAVVLDGAALSSDEMHRFARWTNLSETTFVLPPESADADYRVRIFTPDRELPFAGHPTLGTCHAWLEAGGAPRREDAIVQECDAGLVPIRRSEAGLAFAAPPLMRSGPVEDAMVERVARMLGVERGSMADIQWVDNGPGWVGVLFDDPEAVLALRPRFDELDVGVVAPYPPGSPEAFEVRAFTYKAGAVDEDPVTGSLNASLAQWLLATGARPRPTSPARAPPSAARAASTSSRTPTGPCGSAGGASHASTDTGSAARRSNTRGRVGAGGKPVARAFPSLTCRVGGRTSCRRLLPSSKQRSRPSPHVRAAHCRSSDVPLVIGAGPSVRPIHGSDGTIVTGG
jgi:PhzF family phenazine biosynthesis protein